MITPPDYLFLLIGAVIAALTQLFIIWKAPENFALKLILASCGIAAIASFSFSGALLLIVFVTTGIRLPPELPMVIAAVLSWIGGERVLKAMAFYAARKYDAPELIKDKQ